MHSRAHMHNACKHVCVCVCVQQILWRIRGVGMARKKTHHQTIIIITTFRIFMDILWILPIALFRKNNSGR